MSRRRKPPTQTPWTRTMEVFCGRGHPTRRIGRFTLVTDMPDENGQSGPGIEGDGVEVFLTPYNPETDSFDVSSFKNRMRCPSCPLDVQLRSDRMEALLLELFRSGPGQTRKIYL